MEGFKQFIFQSFEKILVSLILLAAFAGMYFIEEKTIVLNFYYLPVLVSSYLLGRRLGLLTSVFSILAVLLFVAIFPERFLGNREIWRDFALLSSWAGFIILASIIVGSLYELNERRLIDLKKAYIGILELLAKYLESTDRYTKGHSLRVSALAEEVALNMGLSGREVENIRVAGLLHDIGKVEISGEILLKASELSSEERELMDTHAEKGANLLSSVGDVLKEVVPIVLAHHKYFMDPLPSEIKDLATIPLGARIVAVADAFDAMTSDRPYRKGVPPWEALEQIVAKAGKQFDPEVVEVFKLRIGEKLEII